MMNPLQSENRMYKGFGDINVQLKEYAMIVDKSNERQRQPVIANLKSGQADDSLNKDDTVIRVGKVT